jgi:hypothetical protein
MRADRRYVGRILGEEEHVEADHGSSFPVDRAGAAGTRAVTLLL